MTDLLPPNASAAERNIAEGTTRVDAIDVPVGKLWNPWTCPAHLLPWLSWALSVDEWESSWPEQMQRQVIADSVAVHRTKGTLGAVRKAIGALDLDTDVEEWFEYGGDPLSFRVNVWAERYPLDPPMIESLYRTVQRTKNVRSQFELSLNTSSSGSFSLGCGMASGVDACPASFVPNPVAEALHGTAAVSFTELTLSSSCILPEPISSGAIQVAAGCSAVTDQTSSCLPLNTSTEMQLHFAAAASTDMNIETTECF